MVKELKLHDSEYFFKNFRMLPSKFDELLGYIAPVIQKKDTNMREAIGPAERLCVTLRYLVTGDSYVTIGTSYRMSPTSVHRIIQETCSAIWDVFVEMSFLKVPNSERHP